MRPLTALLLAACSPEESAPGPSCEGPGVPTWHNFAQGYVRTWCVSCHSASVPPELRQGAPVGMDFDTWSQVFAWRDRIAARATGPSADMPPLGGVLPQDLELLAQWLQCGAPGEDEPAGPCDTLVSAPAATVASQADADALCAQGNAVEALTVSGEVELPCLCEVGGDLTVLDSASLPLLQAVRGTLRAEASLHAPELREVGEAVLLGGALSELGLPRLATVGGDLQAQDLSLLPALRLEDLYAVGGSMRVTRALHLQRVELPRLRSVGGDLVLEDLPELELLEDTRSLEAVGGSLVLRDLPALLELDEFSFLLLEEVGHELRVELNDQLQGVHGFTVLGFVPGDLVLRDNPALEEISGFDLLVRVSGDLALQRMPELRRLPGFVNLEKIDGGLILEELDPSGAPWFQTLVSAGSFYVQECRSLQVLEGFASLQSISQELVLMGNPQLQLLRAMPQLGSIGAAVSVEDNPRLRGSELREWLRRVEHVEGPVIFSRRDPK